MDLLQNGIGYLTSPVPLFSIGIVFLIAGIAGWYAGHLILWLRRWQPTEWLCGGDYWRRARLHRRGDRRFAYAFAVQWGFSVEREAEFL